ncbi:glycoside hydrolase family 13 protein [Candidatus Neomarinimicrobiota bacterium]
MNTKFHQTVIFAFGVLLACASPSDQADIPSSEELLWPQQIVWYQIFPERFRNGDSTNDPTLADGLGSWPHDSESPWHISPWTSDWYELQPWEQASGHDIWHNIQRRRYGGDIQGIIDRLDYLQNMGIGAIYFNPLFDAPSLHKYDGKSYHHIDPNFGPDPDGDRAILAREIPGDPSTWVWTSADTLALYLISEIHRRGMRLIFDGVFNHLGMRSWPFLDVVENQAASRYKDWFTINSWDDPETPENEFDYAGWFGVRELPELREDEQGLVAGPKEYVFAATRRWMDPNGDGNPGDGIDGWRLDVAFNVAHPFWKNWRKHVKSINPQAYLTAELVASPEEEAKYLQGDEFDAVMNYNFAFISSDYFSAEQSRISTSEFDAALRSLRDTQGSSALIMQNLYDSHDSNRLPSHIVNRDKVSYRDWGTYFNFSKGSNPEYNTRKPNAVERQVQRLMILFQMTYSGAPMVYYGDEAGMWGANDPCPRKPMVWEDMEYAAEAVGPDGQMRPVPDAVSFDKDLHRLYRRLIHIRNSLPALQMGDFQTHEINDEAQIYSFFRNLAHESVLVMLNNSRQPQGADIPAGNWTDLLSGEQIIGGSDPVTVPPVWGRILVQQ